MYQGLEYRHQIMSTGERDRQNINRTRTGRIENNREEGGSGPDCSGVLGSCTRANASRPGCTYARLDARQAERLNARAHAILRRTMLPGCPGCHSH